MLNLTRFDEFTKFDDISLIFNEIERKIGPLSDRQVMIYLTVLESIISEMQCELFASKLHNFILGMPGMYCFMRY